MFAMVLKALALGLTYLWGSAAVIGADINQNLIILLPARADKDNDGAWRQLAGRLDDLAPVSLGAP